MVVSADGCSADFLWESSRVCLSHATDSLHEVRCDAFGSDGKKRDLEMLILQVGVFFLCVTKLSYNCFVYCITMH